MERITVDEAERDLSNLVNRVHANGISIELEEGNKVLARLTPASHQSSLRVCDLNTFLQNLPKLGDAAEAFSEDMRALRRAFPAESNPWD